MRDAHEQVRFGGLAGAKHPVDVLLPLGRVAGVQQRGAEQIGIGEVVAEHLLARRQERDEILVLTRLQVAVGEHERGAPGVRLEGHDAFEVRDGVLGPGGFVVGQRQIQADRAVGGVHRQRRFILRDPVVVLAEPHVGRAEIGPRVRAIGKESQRRLVGIDRAQQVTRLLQLERAREQALEIRRGLGMRRRRHEGKEQWNE